MKLADDWEKAAKLKEGVSKTTRQVIIRSGVVLGSDGGMVQNIRIMFSMGLGQSFGKNDILYKSITLRLENILTIGTSFIKVVDNNGSHGFMSMTSPVYSSSVSRMTKLAVSSMEFHPSILQRISILLSRLRRHCIVLLESTCQHSWLD